MSDYSGSKGIGLKLPVLALVGVTAWFFYAASRGRLPTDDLHFLFGGESKTKPPTSQAAAASDSAADGGVDNRAAASPPTTSAPGPDPFANQAPARTSTRPTHPHAAGN